MKFVLLLLLLLFFTQPIHAFSDPLSLPNNKYGIHIADTQDISDAAFLVNYGGDWGYVTLVIQDTDRNTEKWQKIFDQMRRLHVIPIVRLATRLEGGTWRKPTNEDIRDWKLFLNSLNWPVENRYVVLFNEPNHAIEWGNTINPEEYADTLVRFAEEFKNASPDFFILQAGLDASAPNGPVTMDEETFLGRMVQKNPDILTKIDGWTSHSYPNPAFSGSPLATGKGTLRSFAWELNLLAQLGGTGNLPVFITETGWSHHDGKSLDFSLLRSETVSEYIQTAAASVWNDRRIAAVTPFILNYQDVPFDHFSWRRFGGDGFYPHYYAWRDLSKIRGVPRQREHYEIVKPLLPGALVGDSTTTLIGEIKNTGQAILDAGSGYALKVKDESGLFQFVPEAVPKLEPGENGRVILHATTPKNARKYPLTAEFVKGPDEIELQSVDLHIIPPPSVLITAQLAWRLHPTDNDVTVLVYDADQNVVHKFTGLTLQNGTLRIEGLKNIIPGATYRLVVIVASYLPRQTYATLAPGHSTAKVARLLPLDFNRDGKLTVADVPALLTTRPADVWYRFFGL